MSVFLSHVLSIKQKGFPCHFFLPARLWIFFFLPFFFFFFNQKEDYLVCLPRGSVQKLCTSTALIPKDFISGKYPA